MLPGSLDDERRIAQRRRQARHQRIELDGDFTRLVHRAEDHRSDAAASFASLQQRSAAAPSPALSSVQRSLTVPSPTVPSPRPQSQDAASASSRVESQLFADTKHIGNKSRNHIQHPHQVAADVFCRDSVTLTILQGFAENGQLFFTGDPTEQRHTYAVQRSARVYERLSLHLEVGGSPISSSSDSLIRDEKEDGLRFYSPSSNRMQLSLLLNLPLDHIVGVTRSSKEGSSDELWIETKLLSATAARTGGNSVQSTILSLCVATGSVPTSTKLETLLQNALEESRAQRQIHVVETAASSRLLAKDTLHSLRALRRQTGKFLSDLRSEFVGGVPSQRFSGDELAVLGEGVKEDSHDAWVQRTVARRQHLGEAQSELQAIQLRRQMRAERVSKVISGRFGDSVPYAGIESIHSEKHDRSVAAPFRLERKTTQGVLPRASSASIAVSGDRYMCKHCGENLPDRHEQKDHQHVCAYRMVRCRKCGELVRAKAFEKHRRSNDCRGKPRGSSSRGRKSSDISEVSSSSMEEIGSDTMSNNSSTRSSSASRRRKTPSHLRELPRSDSGRWENLRPVSPSVRRPSTSGSARTPLSQEALRRHNSSLSPSRKLSELSVDRHRSLRRSASTLDDVSTRCVHCGRHAPGSHPARCAYRPVQCAVCGEEVLARDAKSHADMHRR